MQHSAIHETALTRMKVQGRVIGRLGDFFFT